MSADRNKTLKIIISGKVQGVFFRENARKTASKLGIKGYVKNLTDGTVKIMAYGNERALEALKDFCKRGPLLADVKNVETSYLEKGTEEQTEIEEIEGFWVRT